MEHDNPDHLHSQIAAIARRIDRPVVLVGMMAVGKSSIGRKLAAALALPFCDADDEIEAASQLSVAEIFATYGEAYFRSGERRVIARLIAGPPRVIATGGGAFVDPQTRAAVLARAITVWLDSDIDTLLARALRKPTRPLLQTANPRETLVQLRDARAASYAEAPIHVVSSDNAHGDTVSAIVAGIADWLGREGQV